MTSRRDFLQQLSAISALGAVGRMPEWSARFPELEEVLLHDLAAVAIDEAHRGGASFADMRIGAGQELVLVSEYRSGGDRRPAMDPPRLEIIAFYGVRVMIDGAWGLVGGHDLSREGITETVRRALARARANRSLSRRTIDLAPVSTVTDGRWASPIERDPFEVPVEQQVDLQFAALAPLGERSEIRSAKVAFKWERAKRVFASTDGSRITQRTTFATFGGEVWATGPYGMRVVGLEGLEDGQVGYEALVRADVVAVVRRAADRAIAETKIPPPVPVPAEVGRFDLVASPAAMTNLITATLIPALDAGRALGYRAGREGTSFAAPPADVLGRLQVASPLLTIHADRSRPGGDATVGWDDEGVKPELFTLVRDGVIADYLADRQRAAELAPVYRARGMAVRAHGCASGLGDMPNARIPNLTIEPGRGGGSMEDLIRDTKRGIYVDMIGGKSDQQLLNGQFGAYMGTRVIRDGKLGPYVRDLAFQFITPSFWKSLDALGGAEAAKTVRESTGEYGGAGLAFKRASVSAVPGRFRRVNILNTGRTA